MAARIDKIVTSGVFSLDGEDFDVDNNVYVVGDDDECIVIDAAHDAAPILAAIGDRTLRRSWLPSASATCWRSSSPTATTTTSTSPSRSPTPTAPRSPCTPTT